MDRTVLPCVFERLPRLTEVGILFRMTVKGQKWLELYPCSQMAMGTKSWEHHIRVLSHAISIATYSGVSIQTINLLALQIWAHDQRHEGALSESLELARYGIRSLPHVANLTDLRTSIVVYSLSSVNRKGVTKLEAIYSNC